MFVDFDGTVTDVDTFDALVRRHVGEAAWDALDADLHGGRVTLRETLRRQAELIRLSRSEALEFLEATATVDPTFAPFVARARALGAVVRIVSSGIRPIIHDALQRAGVEIEILANEVDFAATGWQIAFVDDSANGHDKAAHVRAARGRGARTVYIGDGISDYEAAREAEVRFAKAARRLERYCRESGIACTSFVTFAEIEAALLGVSERT